LATTITIQQTLNWLTAFLVQRPTTGVGGNLNEPALTTANKIIATITAAPFAWSWNRTLLANAFTTTAGTQDYQVSIPTFGWLETASFSIPGAVAPNPPSKQLEVYGLIGTDTDPSQPRNIQVHLDDNAGNITFRLFPVPDGTYPVTLTIQNAVTLTTALTNNWAPIPDKYSFLYEQGMLAHLQGMYSIPAFLQGMQIFFRQLVGAAEGLSESQRAIFLEDSLRVTRTQSLELGATQGSPRR
jgi:hypothetical protein